MTSYSANNTRVFSLIGCVETKRPFLFHDMSGPGETPQKSPEHLMRHAQGDQVQGAELGRAADGTDPSFNQGLQVLCSRRGVS